MGPGILCRTNKTSGEICMKLLKLTNNNLFQVLFPLCDVVKLRPNCLPGVLSWDLVSNKKTLIAVL